MPTTVDLGKNIPSTIGNLSGLTHIFLYANKITGPLPKESELVFFCENLEELLLSENDFTGSIPEQELSIRQTTRTKKGISCALPTFKYCAILKNCIEIQILLTEHSQVIVYNSLMYLEER